MISKLKFAAYVALIALAIWFGRAFFASYTAIAPIATDSSTNAATDSDTNAQPAPTNQAVPPPAPTNSTRQPTNMQAAPTNGAAAPPSGAAASNSAAASEQTAATAAPVANVARSGKSVRLLIQFVGALAGLGLLIAWDVVQYVGSKAGDYLFSDVGGEMRDPEYELAEQTWVNGKPLEAIEMMREYLKKNPRAQYVALRIAEIYEKDLRNYVAASLEYEEILRKKLPAERWGWAAIHLCNLYSRMGQHDKMKALLERIARDYPTTAAAKKARHNLGLPEPENEEEPEASAPAAPPPEQPAEPNADAEQVFDVNEPVEAGDNETPPPQVAPAPPSAAKSPKSNLPPGFRKK
jgi:TolA-binding protein